MSVIRLTSQVPETTVTSWSWIWGELGEFWKELFTNGWENLGNMLLSLLPLSPFRPYIEQFAALPYLGYLNWFFPIGECMVVMAAWLTTIITYYAYSALLRWIRVIS